MIIFKKAAALTEYLELQRKSGKKTGFVPTMGALHEGHLTLIRQAAAESDLVVCSIFVNPTQFNDPSDFEQYPVSTATDIDMLTREKTSILFLPSVQEIYPEGTKSAVKYALGRMEELFEGTSRPGHFQGVCQVVHRLLDITRPDILFLGQKDYQQCMVIRRLLEITGMNASTALHICPTMREKNGLAMSSRNRRLSVEERENAAAIYSSLNTIKQQLKAGSLNLIVENEKQRLNKLGFSVEYLNVADAGSLEPVENWDGSQKLVVLAAVFSGNVRLIDNLPLN